MKASAPSDDRRRLSTRAGRPASISTAVGDSASSTRVPSRSRKYAQPGPGIGSTTDGRRIRLSSSYARLAPSARHRLPGDAGGRDDESGWRQCNQAPRREQPGPARQPRVPSSQPVEVLLRVPRPTAEPTGEQVANTRPDFDERPRHGRVHERQQAVIEAVVPAPQQRVPAPHGGIAFDLDRLLPDRRRHAMNFSRAAATNAMRSRRTPWLHRWMFVAPYWRA